MPSAERRRLQRDPALIRRIPFPFLGPLDPTTRRIEGKVWHASWTPDGPVTLCFAEDEGAIVVEAFGPGSRAGLDAADGLLGDVDDGAWAQGTRLQKAARGGASMTRAISVADIALRIVFGQRVTSREANDGFRGLVKSYGERAPGPVEDLLLAPRGKTLARLPYYELHRFGVEKKRAHTIQMLGKRERYFESCRELPYEEMDAKLQKLPGIGPWTTGCIRAEFGDADAVQVGDYHLPNLVTWALAGEERGDDARMLELLEPYAGHRQRALRVLHRSVGHAPRRGPKNAPSKWTQDPRF